MVDKIQEIADNNVGRAREALEIAGIYNEALHKKIGKLIFHTADDVRKELEKNIEGEGNAGAGI
jgi:hypothetical protein